MLSTVIASDEPRRRGKRTAPRLTATEKASRDARMQWFLNILQMARVFRAARRSGWGWTTTTGELMDSVHNGTCKVDDYGSTMELQYESGARYRVTDFDLKAGVVTMRKIG